MQKEEQLREEYAVSVLFHCLDINPVRELVSVCDGRTWGSREDAKRTAEKWASSRVQRDVMIHRKVIIVDDAMTPEEAFGKEWKDV